MSTRPTAVDREPEPQLKHHLTLLRGAGSAWATCDCGWESGLRGNTTSAHLAFGEHLTANTDQPLVVTLTAAELAGWHCSLDDPFDFQTAVLAWLDTNRIPLRDEILRGVAAVHLEAPAGDCPTVVVTRYQPPALHGQPPRLERHPMLTPPPARPA